MLYGEWFCVQVCVCYNDRLPAALSSDRFLTATGSFDKGAKRG